jgi:hypothetical protein
MIIEFILIVCAIYLVLMPYKITGGKEHANVLIVDIANMHVGWKMEKYMIKKMPKLSQVQLFNSYLECMRDHYKVFSKHNPGELVNYIVKNYKHSSSGKVVSTPILDKTWEDIKKFTAKHPNATVSVAVDYSPVDITKWKSLHYMRGVDDYLCFYTAREYKRKYVNAVIMSDDIYRDFDKLGFVPKFDAVYVSNGNMTHSVVSPAPNSLGQLVDYKMVKLTLAFVFNDPLFLKTNTYKIEAPGQVWK